jgi:fatty aldehyde-generating acyl-ACP reductase
MMEMAEMDNPKRQMFACFAEAILLEFEGIHTNFSWGRNNISLEAMDLIGAASLRHGFRALELDLAQQPSPSLAGHSRHGGRPRSGPATRRPRVGAPW